ncbi:CAF17-like 4Fe-4S cluster assembly/insertion protein YgfZ [Lysobacter fragariae]
MHDNPRADSAPLPNPVFALPDHRVIALSGRDAAVFAQAQFMNDIKALAPGQWHWNGWLTPKGRVIALFALLKFDEENLWLVLPDTDPVAPADALRRFVFRSKVTIALRDDLHVVGGFATPEHALGNTMAGGVEGGVELDVGGDGGPRCLRLSATSAADTDPAMIARWANFDLEHGLPRLSPSQSDHWTPQQLSLERLGAFSVKKGCYPGQEIVARTHFLGKVKRGLALVQGEGVLNAGDDILASGQPLGHLVASVAVDGLHSALAVVPLEHDAVALSVLGTPVREAPLRDGLAR